MKIVQISTSDIQGGAAKACYRLAKGLRSIGEDCSILVQSRRSNESFISEFGSAGPRSAGFILAEKIQRNYIDRQRRAISNTQFSYTGPAFDLSENRLVQKADVLNLHWVTGYQNPQTIARLASSGTPLVWTLHDQWPFTGGCHYTSGCTRYGETCSSCPQLRGDWFHLTEALLQDKATSLQSAPITIVSPSRWMADCARQSSVLRRHRVVTIPNAVETDEFSPRDKNAARRNFGLREECLFLLFGSESGKEKRKGFQEFLSALRVCMQNPDFAKRASEGSIQVISFGHPVTDFEIPGLQFISLGFLNSPEKLRDAYCAADLFVLPSLEDNLPNTMLESMSCGTPVIAFATGGMPDVITNDVTGLVVPPLDAKALGYALLSLLFDGEKRRQMSRHCRSLMAERFSLEVQAQKYLKLYQEILSEGHRCRTRNDSRSQPVLCPGKGPALQKIFIFLVLKSFTIWVKNRMAGVFRGARSSAGGS